MSTNLNHGTDITVVERKDTPGVWTVEIIDYDDEGSVYLTAFHGPRSKERADAYAALSPPRPISQ